MLFWLILINKPLDKKASLRDRILNGDFDQGPFLLEVELAKQNRLNDNTNAFYYWDAVAYDAGRDAFINQKPFDSWVLDE